MPVGHRLAPGWFSGRPPRRRPTPEVPEPLQHATDEPGSDDRYLLDQPVAWSRVGIAVGVVLVAALVLVAAFPDAAVAAVDAVLNRFAGVTR